MTTIEKLSNPGNTSHGVNGLNENIKLDDIGVEEKSKCMIEHLLRYAKGEEKEDKFYAYFSDNDDELRETFEGMLTKHGEYTPADNNNGIMGVYDLNTCSLTKRVLYYWQSPDDTQMPTICGYYFTAEKSSSDT